MISTVLNKIQFLSKISPKGDQVAYFIIQVAEESHRRIFLNVAVKSSEMSHNLSAPIRVKVCLIYYNEKFSLYKLQFN